MNKIALGTAQFGIRYGIANQTGQVSRDEAKSILTFARNRGIDTLDTAVDYGESEVRLGEIGVEGWQVITKLPAIPKDCRDVHSWVINVLQESLERLQIKSLYGLLLHQPDQLLHDSGKALFQTMVDLKSSKLVHKIGISIYDPKELDVLCKKFQFDIVQAPFNILDRRMLYSGWSSRLSRYGIELHVRSVFLQGLLLMRKEVRPKKFKRWQNLWEHWDKWLKDAGVTPLSACMRYALSFSEINKVIVGVDSLNHLKEILESSEGTIPEVNMGPNSNDLNLINPSCWNDL